MAEYFRDSGRHALCVYDDLSKQAVAYRQLSLLLRRPPGREAYPGRRLLHPLAPARARRQDGRRVRGREEGRDRLGQARRRQGPQGRARASSTPSTELKEKGDDYHIVKNPRSGGSLTALPIIETQAGDVCAYIPTNVISITDGQIFLETRPLLLGRPPRHQRRHLGQPRRRQRADQGDEARSPARLKLDLAQYREMAAFAQFASDLDKVTRDQLERGARLVEILKQGQYVPLRSRSRSSSSTPARSGYLDKLDIEQLGDVRARPLRLHREEVPEDLRGHPHEEGARRGRPRRSLKKALDEFGTAFGNGDKK